MAKYSLKVITFITVEADSEAEARREYQKENYEVEFESIESVEVIRKHE